MPYVNLEPGQKVTVTICGYLDEVLVNGVKVSYADGEQIEVFTETDDVTITVDDTGVAATDPRSVLDEPAVAYDREDPNAPKAGS
jgi:hypothetical protein